MPGLRNTQPPRGRAPAREISSSPLPPSRGAGPRTSRAPLLLALLLTGLLAVGVASAVGSGISPAERAPLLLVIAAAAATMLAAAMLGREVLAADTGTAEMRIISDAIQEGAEAFMRRQYRTIGWIAAATAVLLFAVYLGAGAHASSTPLRIAVMTALAFVFGAACSATAGVVGMWVAIRANIRVAAAARETLSGALRLALRGGAVAGLFVAALALAGVAALFAILRATGVPASQAPLLIVGYGFGASFVALFAQLGGGIYTKAADVGADLVGKVEAGIPEDDPRNPAVIADLVGDNVGDCAGRGADVFESLAAENIGAMILAIALISAFGPETVLLPLLAGACGLIASVAGVLTVRMHEGEDPMRALNRGFYVTTAIALAGLGGLCRWLLAGDVWLVFFGCAAIGVAASIAFVFITEYYTEHRYAPVRYIAQQSRTGSATNIIAGLAVGLESTVLPVVIISAAVLASFALGATTGLPSAGLFGTAVATLGMLASAGYILAMDNFGPITDNAGGIVEMSGQPPEVRRRTDLLDAAGNTTKALTKGYALGSAGLAAFLLFSAYLDAVRAFGAVVPAVDLSKPAVFVAGMLGATLVFVFASTAIRAVGTAAGYVIEEVRRQFSERPDILAGTARPDYARCVDLVTRGALRQMVVPGLIAVTVPVLAGFTFKWLGVGPEAVAAFLMVATIAGILLATLLNNGGGAWDNAKKFIEIGAHGGKGSDAHHAAVVGDTVGDPFKDTAGPAIHVLVKLLATIMLVLAPFLV